MTKISTAQRQIIKKIVHQYRLQLVLLFGSRVSGLTHRESDFDIAYKSAKPLSLEKEARLIVDLALIFKSENVDLVNLRRASPLLLYAIMNECQVLYAKDHLDFFTLRAYAFRRYMDEAKPLIKARFDALQLKLH